jgi:hypothetical protein
MISQGCLQGVHDALHDFPTPSRYIFSSNFWGEFIMDLGYFWGAF